MLVSYYFEKHLYNFLMTQKMSCKNKYKHLTLYHARKHLLKYVYEIKKKKKIAGVISMV